MITNKELISKFQILKQIKPRENWVIFAKSQIFSPSAKAESNIFEPEVVNRPSYRDILTNIFRVPFQIKYAYALAVFLFMVAGIVGVMQFGLFNSNNSELKISKQPAALVEIKNNVEEFKTKSKNLSELARYKSEDVSLAIQEVKEATKKLTEAIEKNPQLAKEVALDINNNKTYLEIVGVEDLNETSYVLYKTIVEQMIKDLESTTLTENQQQTLGTVKNLYEEGNYTSALESILLLSIAISENN